MSITWLLSMISVLIMFVGVGFSPLRAEKLAVNPHAVIGLIAICLTFIQPTLDLIVLLLVEKLL